tara:strand:- start:240 stop:365 length:126 start_codon:yes stop_codon:yes gene_type:complete
VGSAALAKKLGRVKLILFLKVPFLIKERWHSVGMTERFRKI